jgi:hypothetical protein
VLQLTLIVGECCRWAIAQHRSFIRVAIATQFDVHGVYHVFLAIQ